MICNGCNQDVTRVTFHYPNLDKGYCSDCNYAPTTNQSHGIITDSIPGGIEIKHGICNPDGTPRRFDSKSDIRRAAFEQGWTISGETPKVNPRLQEQRANR